MWLGEFISCHPGPACLQASLIRDTVSKYVFSVFSFTLLVIKDLLMWGNDNFSSFIVL